MNDRETDKQADRTGIVFTNKAQCRDCYRCVRACPVKAIRMQGGQASVDVDRCVACGTCIRECPQRAKTYRRDLTAARALLAGEAPVAVSIAPSFAGLMEDWKRRRLPSALRRLGFVRAAETAIGAWHVARQTARRLAEEPDRPHIATACPAVVNYVERYHPDAAKWLTPIVSPMVAHARLLRKSLGDGVKVVFVGPCVAKKDEADRDAMLGEVDAVLTFEELFEWLDEEGIDLATCEESPFDEVVPGDAQLFPLAGGALQTADIVPDMLAVDLPAGRPDSVAVHGYEELTEALENVQKKPRGVLIEALFCRQGCINGPAAGCEDNCFQRRLGVLEYRHEQTVAGASDEHPAGDPDEADVSTAHGAFAARPLPGDEEFREEDIQRVLERTGKATTDQHLNCGACGYSTCRAKAVAVLQGLAEPEMCIPHMRRLAEQRTDRIIETSPNGIVILDEQRNILNMNPAFRKMFMCSEATAGRNISCLMDPDMFERLAGGGVDMLESVVRHPSYGAVCHQVAYALREEKQYVGIFVNITNLRENEKQLDLLRTQTVTKAKELLDHQLAMAQQIAEFLGESTAGSEELLENLMRMTRDPYDRDEKTSGGPAGRSAGPGRGNEWKSNTYMSR